MIRYAREARRWHATSDERLEATPEHTDHRKPLARVTVVIPCYNYGRFLRDCVQSVLAQEGVEVDALIVDDGSTDDSREVAARLAESDPRVELIQHKRNEGHITTFNEGLATATGDYLVLISADDLLTRGSLARATAVMEQRADVGFVYGNPVVIYDSNVVPARTRRSSFRVWTGPEWIAAQCRRGTSCIYSPEVCVRASVQRAAGPYNPALPLAADLEMWLRIAAISSVARVVSDQAYKRVHGQGMIQTSYPEFLADLRERHAAYESFFSGAGARVSGSQLNRSTVQTRLAVEALEYAAGRLKAGGNDTIAAEEYLAFAFELLGSDAAHLRAYREYQLALEQSARKTPLGEVSLRHGQMRRDVKRRIDWYHWRLTGV